MKLLSACLELAYDRVAEWLDGKDDAPDKVKAVRGLDENLRLQDKIGDAMRELRHQHGALDLDTIEARPIIRDGQVVSRKMMNLSSSFDHRVVDGWDAAAFIQRVRGLLEQPATLFID